MQPRTPEIFFFIGLSEGVDLSRYVCAVNPVKAVQSSIAGLKADLPEGLGLNTQGETLRVEELCDRFFLPVQSNEGSARDQGDLCENTSLTEVFPCLERSDRFLVLLTGKAHLHEGELCPGLVSGLDSSGADRAVKKSSGLGLLPKFGGRDPCSKKGLSALLWGH